MKSESIGLLSDLISMENLPNLLLEIAMVVESGSDDETMMQKVEDLSKASDIPLIGRTSNTIPNKMTVAYTLRQLAVVAENLEGVDMKAWPSAARNMLAKSLENIAALYGGIA